MKIFFEPSGIIIAGATDNPAKPQYYLPKNILEYGYKGKVFLVNPRLKELFGQKVYPSISSVPESVDLAMLVVPSRPIPGMVTECGQKGIKGVIIGSG
ncbi:MAG: CoA-binding protein, partial [Thermodesulfobacteriota bacterium]|nr:CoA-binding protein [Thermodesulfobacteriota bacterium]